MTKQDEIVRRIVDRLGIPDVIQRLTDCLGASDMQSLLLDVYRMRTSKLSPKNVLDQYKNNRFVRPAQVDPKQQILFDRLAFFLLPADFDVLELSPVAPLGSCSVVGTVSQNNVVSTARNTEVLADLSNVLALECAVRRRKLLNIDPLSKEIVKLSASQRLVRAQMFDQPTSFAHFRLFSLCSAGRDTGSFSFEISALREHIEYFIALIEQTRQLGCVFGKMRITITAYNKKRRAIVEQELLEPLSTLYNNVTFEPEHERTSGKGYYDEVSFQVHVCDSAGQSYLIVDGGFTSWTRQYLSNNKERLLISGMGSERFLFCFGDINPGESS